VTDDRSTALPYSVLVISDSYDDVSSASDVIALTYIDSPGLPSPEEMSRNDAVLILGSLRNADRALELAGAVRLALEQGAVIVFAYAARLDTVDSRFLAGVVPVFAKRITGTVRAVASDPAPHPAFREYVTLHGQTDLAFTFVPDEAEVLADAVTSDSPYETAATALAISAAPGALYILPYHLHAGTDPLLERLVSAVMQHRESTAAAPEPGFFALLDLPGERDVRERLSLAKEAVDELEGQRREIVRHKLVIGHLQGQVFENLVIEELNLVFDGSGLTARDGVDINVEDFVIADASDEVVALCEAKGVGRGIGLRDVDQVNAHRTEWLDRGAEELPGLLIVNAFRNDETLDRRREPVSDRVARHAQRMNVLVMRSWDLYQLVARRLAGHDDSLALAHMLLEGGGWLEVDEDDGMALRTGSDA
jgi:hypothetical protein